MPHPMYPVIDEQLSNFVIYARSLRLSVTRQLIQERARRTTQANGISNFKASSGYIEKFLRRSGVQNSVRLHGRAGVALPSTYIEIMAEIRTIMSNYPLSHVCNMDESSLFYRLGPVNCI